MQARVLTCKVYNPASAFYSEYYHMFAFVTVFVYTFRKFVTTLSTRVRAVAEEKSL
jgi:hypothetical protein